MQMSRCRVQSVGAVEKWSLGAQGSSRMAWESRRRLTNSIGRSDVCFHGEAANAVRLPVRLWMCRCGLENDAQGGGKVRDGSEAQRIKKLPTLIRAALQAHIGSQRGRPA